MSAPVHADKPYKELVVTVENGIGTLKINRPKSLNSLVPDVYLELVRGLRQMAENPSVVITVVTGEGLVLVHAGIGQSDESEAFRNPGKS